MSKISFVFCLSAMVSCGLVAFIGVFLLIFHSFSILGGTLCALGLVGMTIASMLSFSFSQDKGA